ncbi:MAG: hypothetical protein Q9167_002098 [Letrouitia subvulpina]
MEKLYEPFLCDFDGNRCTLSFKPESGDPEVSEVWSSHQPINTQKKPVYDIIHLHDAPPILSVVWIARAADWWSFDLPRKDLEDILNASNLDLAFKYGYFGNQGMRYIHDPTNNKGQSLVCTCRALSMGITWVYDLKDGTTFAVCWSDPFLMPVMKDSLNSIRQLAQYALFPAFVAATALLKELKDSIYRIIDEMERIEIRTRHRDYAKRDWTNAATGDYAALSEQLNGFATRLAILERNKAVLTWILDDLTAFQKRRDTTDALCKSSLEEINKFADKYLGILKDELDGNSIHLPYLSRKIQIQLQVIFHLITSRETRVSIAVAEDSRALASTTKEDSTAMKTLAIVTVTFLPGTFIAALFDIPVFDWEAKTRTAIVSHRFWMYWAVTIPLTLLTILPLVLWTKRTNNFHRAQLARTRKKFVKDIRRLGEDIEDEYSPLESYDVKEKTDV